MIKPLVAKARLYTIAMFCLCCSATFAGSAQAPSDTKIIDNFSPTGLELVTASAGTVRGLICSSWTNKSVQVNWKVTVPINSMTSVYIPYRTGKTVTESGKRIWANGSASGKVSGIELKGIETDVDSGNQYIVWTVGSGDYEFQW